MSELVIKEAEVRKLDLGPNDVLAVTVKGDDFDHAETMYSLKQAFQNYFPNNRVMVFSMGKDHDIKIEVIKEGEKKDEPADQST
jgi:hypothetical protein